MQYQRDKAEYPHEKGVQIVGECFLTSLFTVCFISTRALVYYWAIKWSAVNSDRDLKGKFCQKISVQYVKRILWDTCLKTQIFTANSATQLKRQYILKKWT